MSGTVSNKPFNVGRDCQVVLIWSGTTIKMPTVTGFQSQQQTNELNSSPLNGLPTFLFIENGWRGQFDVDRNTANLDELIAAKELAFWNAGTIGLGTIYQYVSEVDGSTSTWEYQNVTIRLTDAGRWQQEAKVSQRVEFACSTKVQIS